MYCCVESASNTVQSTPKLGRSFLSKVKYRVGSIVTECNPFSWLLSISNWESMCATCFRKDPSLLRCSGCKKFRYCSKTCQKNDWHVHKSVCPHIYSILLSHNDSEVDDILILIQSLFASKSKSELCTIIPHLNSIGRVVCGYSHFHAMSDYGSEYDTLHSDRRIVSIVSEISGYHHDVVLKTLRLFRGNNFGIMDSLLSCVGVGVYPHAAILNHSCAPNCILRFSFSNIGPILKVFDGVLKLSHTIVMIILLLLKFVHYY